MNVRRRKQHRAFTLAEVLVALALLAFIMVAAALGIQAAQTSYSYNSQKAELTARARGVIDRIYKDVRRSASFTVVDVRTVQVSMPDGTAHTYTWDGTVGGNLNYTETDAAGIVSDPAVMTGYVQSFAVEEANQSCRVQITLTGTRASSSLTVTATPGKVLF